MYRAKTDDETGTSSAGSRSCVPNIPGAEDVMSEMTRRLRERRAKAENNGAQVSDAPDVQMFPFPYLLLESSLWIVLPRCSSEVQ